jgi:superfamily II DNA or RNA helicase
VRETGLRAPGTLSASLEVEPPGVRSLFTAFQPHFRVQGRNYSGQPSPEERASPGRPAWARKPIFGSRHQPRAAPSATRTVAFFGVWDAIWPILQPPLNFAFTEVLDLPSELRQYQYEGVRFLADAEAALLGDDMGTGKTVQAAVALRILFQKGRVRSALVVCPLAVLSVWQQHLQDWAPVISLVTVRGTRAERRALWSTQSHVHLTTYETVREDTDSLDEPGPTGRFDLVIADEIQRIKNPDAAVSRAMRELAAPRRWGLSGTPLENRLEDLVAIFAFLKPGLLRRGVENPGSVRTKIAPFFLRRTKDVLKSELPEKVPSTIWLDLQGAQRRAYEVAEREGVVELGKQGARVTVTHVLALLGKLKEICNFDPPTGQSAKLETLKELLDPALSQGTKALVFSQFVRWGVSRIAAALPREEGALEYTGALSEHARRSVLEKFSADPSHKVLVCTHAAAGLGIDLTAANYVFHFDHWWNPAREDQATSRAHRFGQKKSQVFVYHLWVRGTVEERVYRKLQQKRAEFDEVIGAMSNVEGTGLSEEELFDIFGLKKPRRGPPVRATARPPAPAPPAATGPPAGAGAAVPDIEVWPLIRETELAFRACIREVMARHYGPGAGSRAIRYLGSQEAERIAKTISAAKQRYANRYGDGGDLSPSENPLDYVYLAQLVQIVCGEWALFKPIFGERRFLDERVKDVAGVRNDEAHFRSIPAVEKMRAYVACSDLLTKLKPPVGQQPPDPSPAG